MANGHITVGHRVTAFHSNSEVKHGRARVVLRTAVGDHAGRPGAAYFALFKPFAFLLLTFTYHPSFGLSWGCCGCLPTDIIV